MSTPNFPKVISPLDYEFVSMVWLVQRGHTPEYAKNHWQRVDLVYASYDDKDYFYVGGTKYRITNAYEFFVPKMRVPKEMVSAAKEDWIDTQPGYANRVIAESEVQAFEDTRFMTDEELAEMSDDRLPAGQRVAIWILAALLCGLFFAIIALTTMGPV